MKLYPNLSSDTTKSLNELLNTTTFSARISDSIKQTVNFFEEKNHKHNIIECFKQSIEKNDYYYLNCGIIDSYISYINNNKNIRIENKIHSLTDIEHVLHTYQVQKDSFYLQHSQWITINKPFPFVPDDLVSNDNTMLQKITGSRKSILNSILQIFDKF